ncbi:YbaN family protein [Henriciella aquimarina]|uniref:YbaN family protein n=1 Tax=Henriciella aquimarina TaxID=545261 RepID=UPI0009FCE57B|nr:YbaN family protein [Henriciella aquimarina]
MIARLLGFLFLALGAIGIFLPVWPTTIFWIIAALAFTRSSPAMRDWIYARPKLGPPIRDFVEQGTLSRASKTGAIAGMSLAAAISTALLWGRWTWIAVALGLIAVGMAYVLTRPSEPV